MNDLIRGALVRQGCERYEVGKEKGQYHLPIWNVVEMFFRCLSNMGDEAGRYVLAQDFPHSGDVARVPVWCEDCTVHGRCQGASFVLFMAQAMLVPPVRPWRIVEECQDRSVRIVDSLLADNDFDIQSPNGLFVPERKGGFWDGLQQYGIQSSKRRICGWSAGDSSS